MAETPAAAMLMLHPLRMAIQGEGQPELIPSFFFQLQSPTVEAYKKGQDQVIDDITKEKKKKIMDHGCLQFWRKTLSFQYMARASTRN